LLVGQGDVGGDCQGLSAVVDDVSLDGRQGLLRSGREDNLDPARDQGLGDGHSDPP